MAKKTELAVKVEGKEAAEYLRRKGYRVLATNYKNRWGKVDIVAKAREMVVLVEVKIERGSYREPWEMVRSWEIKQLERVGKLWREEYKWKGECRIDVVEVYVNEDEKLTRIEHWENVGS